MLNDDDLEVVIRVRALANSLSALGRVAKPLSAPTLAASCAATPHEQVQHRGVHHLKGYRS